MTTFSAPGSDFVRDASILSDDEVMMDARQARDLSPCSVIDPADPRYGKCEQVCLHGGLCSRRMATGSTMCTQHTKLHRPDLIATPPVRMPARTPPRSRSSTRSRSRSRSTSTTFTAPSSRESTPMLFGEVKSILVQQVIDGKNVLVPTSYIDADAGGVQELDEIEHIQKLSISDTTARSINVNTLTIPELAKYIQLFGGERPVPSLSLEHHRRLFIIARNQYLSAGLSTPPSSREQSVDTQATLAPVQSTPSASRAHSVDTQPTSTPLSAAPRSAKAVRFDTYMDVDKTAPFQHPHFANSIPVEEPVTSFDAGIWNTFTPQQQHFLKFLSSQAPVHSSQKNFESSTKQSQFHDVTGQENSSAPPTVPSGTPQSSGTHHPHDDDDVHFNQQHSNMNDYYQSKQGDTAFYQQQQPATRTHVVGISTIVPSTNPIQYHQSQHASVTPHNAVKTESSSNDFQQGSSKLAGHSTGSMHQYSQQPQQNFQQQPQQNFQHPQQNFQHPQQNLHQPQQNMQQPQQNLQQSQQDLHQPQPNFQHPQQNVQQPQQRGQPLQTMQQVLPSLDATQNNTSSKFNTINAQQHVSPPSIDATHSKYNTINAQQHASTQSSNKPAIHQHNFSTNSILNAAHQHGVIHRPESTQHDSTQQHGSAHSAHQHGYVQVPTQSTAVEYDPQSNFNPIHHQDHIQLLTAINTRQNARQPQQPPVIGVQPRLSPEVYRNTHQQNPVNQHIISNHPTGNYIQLQHEQQNAFAAPPLPPRLNTSATNIMTTPAYFNNVETPAHMTTTASVQANATNTTPAQFNTVNAPLRPVHFNTTHIQPTTTPTHFTTATTSNTNNTIPAPFSPFKNANINTSRPSPAQDYSGLNAFELAPSTLHQQLRNDSGAVAYPELWRGSGGVEDEF